VASGAAGTVLLKLRLRTQTSERMTPLTYAALATLVLLLTCAQLVVHVLWADSPQRDAAAKWLSGVLLGVLGAVSIVVCLTP